MDTKIQEDLANLLDDINFDEEVTQWSPKKPSSTDAKGKLDIKDLNVSPLKTPTLCLTGAQVSVNITFFDTVFPIIPIILIFLIFSIILVILRYCSATTLW